MQFFKPKPNGNSSYQYWRKFIECNSLPFSRFNFARNNEQNILKQFSENLKLARNNSKNDKKSDKLKAIIFG